jgi:RNase P protein component
MCKSEAGLQVSRKNCLMERGDVLGESICRNMMKHRLRCVSMMLVGMGMLPEVH